MVQTTTLYRPVNDKELELIAELDYEAFPPRLPEQPIFYPVMNEEYATEITKKWNVTAYGVGYVTAFEVDSEYLEKFEVKNVGGPIHDELWIPAEQLNEFNAHIIGKIEVISTFE